MKLSVITRLSLILLTLSFFGCNDPGEKRIVSAELRTMALSKLQETLHDNSVPAKIYAAECLIKLGYRENIHTLFLEEEKQKRQDYFNRVLIWKVLTQASVNPEEKQQWLDSISSVYKNPDAPDHINASESLAKLGISPFSVNIEITDSIVNGIHNSLWLYTLWGSAYQDEERSKEVRSQLTQILVNPKEQAHVRKIASHALSSLKNPGPANWDIMINTACNEPDSSSLLSFIISSALINTPEDSLSSSRVRQCTMKAKEILNDPVSEGKVEILTAVAEIGGKEDIPLLASIIDPNSDYKLKGITDLVTASANAILRADRRQKYTLHNIDWGIIGLYGICMLLIGWFYARKSKNTEDYLLGGRKMRPIAVGLSLFATMVSSLSYLSYPGEMIKNGPVFFIGMIIFPLVYYIVGWFIIPRFMEIKVTSAYELLEKRLGLSVRMLATFFFLSLRFLWLATIIYATINTALVAVVDISPAYTPYISIFLMLLTMVYTSMGGFKAVVATDVIQSLVLWGGAFLTIFIISLHFKSLTSWLPDHYLGHWSPLKWGLDIRERATIGNAMVWLMVWFVCTNGSDQMAVQRYLSTKDIRAARHTFGISLIATFVVKIFLAFVGLAMIAYFSENPHFLEDGKTLTEQADQLFPKFILIGLPVGISGLVASGIFAAAMSSLSSGLNSSSSVISEDIIKRLTPKLISSNPLRQVKIISLFVGIIAIILSLAIGGVEGNLLDVVIKVVNLFVAPLFVLFFMAIFIPFATSRGTISGGLAGVAIAIAASFYEFMGITVLWIMPSALICGIITGILVSLIEKIFNNTGHSPGLSEIN